MRSKAEYEAGFIQGKLQAVELPDTRDNLWDQMYLLDPAVTGKQQPPTAAALDTAAGVLIHTPAPKIAPDGAVNAKVIAAS